MRAYAPGSVTGLFAPAIEQGATSRGASFALEDGVVADVTPAPTTSVTVDGAPAPFEAVENVLDALGVTAAVDVRPSVPLGHGFGASGAATLATALAADAGFDLGKRRNALVDAAHRAELDAGTGQGDVYIQARGGLLWSANGEVHRVEPTEPVEYVTAGGIPTEEMLADAAFMDAASEVGGRLLDDLAAPPTLRELADASRTYVEATGISTPVVSDWFDRVGARGGSAGMALFGETVFAVDVEGVLPNRSRVATDGARVLGDG